MEKPPVNSPSPISIADLRKMAVLLFPASFKSGVGRKAYNKIGPVIEALAANENLVSDVKQINKFFNTCMMQAGVGEINRVVFQYFATMATVDNYFTLRNDFTSWRLELEKAAALKRKEEDFNNSLHIQKQNLD